MKNLVPFFLIFVVASPLVAAPVGYQLSPLHGKRQVTFYSKAPLENFEGTVKEINGSVTVDYAKRNLNLQATITIPVMSMQTGITMRDVHMRSRDWLHEDRYPNIKFELGSPKFQKVKKKGKNKWFVKTKGRLTIRGRTKDIEVPVTLIRKKTKKGNFLHIKGGFTVNIKDFGVRGPLAMKLVGAKVSETIKISLKIVGKEMPGWGNSKKYSW